MIKIILVFLAIALGSYLLGNISVARLLSKVIKTDITKLGSGNPGTINMARNFGWKMGLLTLVLDMLKAIIPCLSAYFIGLYVLPVFTPRTFIFVAGLSVILGHMFPVFYKFKGGKGIACALGVYAVAYPVTLAIFLAIGLIILLSTKIGSLASLIIVTGLSVIGIINFVHYTEIVLIAIIYVLLVWAHRSNIVRLLHGKENKVILFKKKEKTDVSEKL